MSKVRLFKMSIRKDELMLSLFMVVSIVFAVIQMIYFPDSIPYEGFSYFGD